MKRADKKIEILAHALLFRSNLRHRFGSSLTVQAEFVLITANTTPSQLRLRVALPGTDYFHVMSMNIAQKIKNKKITLFHRTCSQCLTDKRIYFKAKKERKEKEEKEKKKKEEQNYHRTFS